MASDQQFCLRWNNHQNTLVSIFDSLLESGTLVDCTLAAEGRFLQAHKVVLSACSPYFAMLLREHYDKFPILILKDIKYQELQAMMNYMYRGEVNITQETLGSFLKAAESLQIRGLTDNSHCVENNNGIIRDNNSLHGTGSLYSHSNKKLSSDSRKLHGSGGGGSVISRDGATPLISQQRSRSPPSLVTQTQSSKKYLKSSSAVVVENHHHAAAVAAAAAAAAAVASINNTNNSKSSSDMLENNSPSIKRRKLLPPIKSEGLVVTPINPSSTISTYNNIDVSNVCEVPSQAQSMPAMEGKANVPSPSIPPKVESPHMDITPVISNKVPPITNSTPNCGAALADGLMKNKSISDMIKVKNEQLEDSYNEDTNDDSYTTEDNDNERDENSHLSMAGLPFHNNQSATNFDSSTDRSLLGPDGNNSLQDSPDTRANDEIVSQFVIKLSKSLPVDYCNAMSAAQQQQQQQQQAVTEQQSHAISTTSTFGCQPVACGINGGAYGSSLAAAASLPATPPAASASKVCFPCDACGNVYNYKTSLARHQRFECGKDPQFQCPFCEHRTKHKSSLTTHIDCKHKQELMYDESRVAGGSFWREYNGTASCSSSSLTKT